MRVISGKARGTKLYTLEGLLTRPTLDRVKESLFNIISNKIKDCVFLDLFAGSGAIGIEAASRGAKKVILCDKSKEAMKVIKKNIEKTHLEEIIQVYCDSYENVLNKGFLEKPDIIYLDPPYNTDYVFLALKQLLEKNLLKKETLVIIETDDSERIEKQLEILNLEKTDKRKYGRAYLIFLKQKEI